MSVAKRIRSAVYMAQQRVAKAKLYRERREFALEFLGGVCVVPDCGRSQNLHIDHIDFRGKEFGMGQIPTYDALVAELAKCQLLCGRHHRLKHRSDHQYWNAKLTPAQVCEIRRRLGLGEVGRRLAEEFRVGPMEISRIKNGQRWSWL